MAKITLPDGSMLETADGTTAAQVAQRIGPALADAAVAAKVNGQLVDLSTPLNGNLPVQIVTLKDKDQMLASVLLDLSQNASLSSSMDASDQVLDELRRIGKIRKPQVQQAPFIVLKSPDIPSMLIETAFISNRYDESNLGSVQYQERIAQAIFAGVRHYFYENPPPGTKVATLARTNRLREVQHVIRRGDTLTGIANRYQVPVGQIRDINQIPGDKLVIGRVLRIPQPQDI